MRVMPRLFLATAAVLLVSRSAASQTLGVELLKKCNASIAALDGSTTFDAKDAVFCRAFIEGVMQTSTAVQTLAAQAGKGGGPEWLPQVVFCAPASVKFAQEIRVVHKWLQEHPAERYEPAGLLVLIALGKAFPCE